MLLQDNLRLTPPLATALLLSLALTPLVRRTAVRYGWVSRPVQDRWGRRAIARLGGVAMYAAFILSVLCWIPLDRSVIGLLAGTTLVFGLGLADDIKRMSPYTKLLGQLLIGTLVVLSGIQVNLVQWGEWVAIPVSVLWFVLVMNAFNLLDNMDGLAGGIGAIAAGFCAIHAAMCGQWTVATLAAIVCGSSLGFLSFNFPPAKIFMGDSGSHLLGLSLAVLALMGTWQHSTQLLSVLAFPAMVLAVPIFDTCFVTFQRLLNRQHPFVGGTDHVSHRLAILGLSVRQTVITLYAVSVAFGIFSLVSVQLRLLPALALWLSVFTVLILFGAYLANVKVYRLEERPTEEETAQLPTTGTRIETMLLHKRRLLEILIDFCLICSVYVFAYLLRFEGSLSGDLQRLIMKSLPILLVAKLSSFAAYGLYRGGWRYLSLSDIMTIFRAVSVGSTVSALILLYAWRFEGFSRAVLIIDAMLTFLAIGGSRVVERLLDEWITLASARGKPVIIIGTGDAGARIVRLLKDEEPVNHRVVAFLDDDRRMHGMVIHGVPVAGGRDRLKELIARYGVREVLVAISDPPGNLLEHIRACCEPNSVAWRVVTASVTDATYHACP